MQVIGSESRPGTASDKPKTVFEGLEKSFKRLRTGPVWLETGFHRLMIGLKELETETGFEPLKGSKQVVRGSMHFLRRGRQVLGAPGRAKDRL